MPSLRKRVRCSQAKLDQPLVDIKSFCSNKGIRVFSFFSCDGLFMQNTTRKHHLGEGTLHPTLFNQNLGCNSSWQKPIWPSVAWNVLEQSTYHIVPTMNDLFRCGRAELHLPACEAPSVLLGGLTKPPVKGKLCKEWWRGGLLVEFFSERALLGWALPSHSCYNSLHVLR